MMQRKKYKIHCLFSSVNYGKIVTFKNNIVEEDIPKILLFKKLSVEDVQAVFRMTPLPTALIVENGSFAGHPSVLLNSQGIQLVVMKKIPKSLADSFVFIDGLSETMQLCSTKECLEKNIKKIHSNIYKTASIGNLFYKGEPVRVNVDGKTPRDINLGLKNGASGVGILRTEWLGWNNKLPPTIEDHLKLYLESIHVLKGKKLNIRLFDLGGDKIPIWANKVKNQIKSPLGLRGIRAISILKQAFDNQLQAIASISKKNKIGIVLPMISNPQEIVDFKNYFMKLTKQNLHNIQIGAMVETPSSALLIKEIYKYADFVRIGPGDLSQFTLATLRENITPLDLSGNTLNKAVIKLIKMVTLASIKLGKEANICIDVEPREPLILQLLRVGIRTFNVSPQNVSVVREIVDKIA